jgi:hypothetical protein
MPSTARTLAVSRFMERAHMSNDDNEEKGEPSNDGAEYKVGDKKPPKHGQFKPGKSGNPKGRPKGARNFKTLIAVELNSPIKIHEGGKCKTVTKWEAMAKLWVSNAVNGDAKALDRLMPIIAEIEAEQKKAEQEPEFSWTEEQEELFQQLQAMRESKDPSEEDRQNGE